MTGRTNIGLFIVMLLMWLSVCATAFCMPMQCPFHIWSPYKTKYGNNFVATSSYDDVHRWVAQRQLQDINGNYLQNINYEYDGVGNIMRVTQSAPTYGNNMGGEYVVDYTYDEQYRLMDTWQRSSSLGDYAYSMSYSPSGLVGTKLNPELGADMTFGYRYEGETPLSHQPKMLYFPSYYEDITLLGWNTNGQMTSMLQPYQDRFRRHWWDETGQLAAAIGNEYCGYYGYNANGERVYKLTGTVYADQYNAGDVNIETYFDDMVLYVNPYMVITPRGYTKHYYNGSQRIAARLGEQWVDCGITVDEQDRTSLAREVLEDRMNSTEVEEESLGQEWCRSIYGEEFSPESYMLRTNYMNCNYNEDMLWDVIFYGTQYSDYMGGIARGIFYYHPDHLGSATWITDDQRQAVQYIHYMPYGELWANDQALDYDEKFKFTGKERDTETGYDYFGARYYLSLLGIWLSPDPLLDKYPNISSYAFCGWNPINRIDIDGQDWYRAEDGSAVLWRSGSDASIDVNNSAYNNIGESYSFVQNGITYNYRQNEIISIGVNVMNGDNFISQFAQDYWGETPANQACQKACDAMLRSAGFTSSFSSNVIVDNINGSAGSASLKSSQVIAEMTDNLYAGYPSKVSVDIHPGNTSHADKIGDHFVIIMGVTEYLSKGNVVGANYRFFEPGTRHKNLGTSSSAVFRLTGGRLVGNAPYGQKRPYVVSSIRFCK